VADTGTDIVRIAPDGSVEVLAGTGTADFGGDGKPAIQAKLNSPHALAYSPSGELYVADSANNRVRKIATDGTIVTVAGPGGATLGDGGLATDASLLYPTGLAFDAQGNLYIAENGGNRLRRVDAGSGVIHTLAGSPNGDGGFAGDGGMATKALLRGPGAIAVSATGDIYVTDVNNNRVRRIAPDGTITTVA
jgi:sugar lactone lactonase YvrE